MKLGLGISVLSLGSRYQLWDLSNPFKFQMYLSLGFRFVCCSGSWTFNFWVFRQIFKPAQQSSPRSLLVPTPTARTATTCCNPVTGAQGRIATEAGHCQGQSSQSRPARGRAWVAWLTSTGVREVTLGVRQAVVQQALCTPQAAEPAH